MDNETRDARSGVAAAPPPSRVVASETRTLWLPDVWAVYIANGEDPESGDWPVSDCDEELRRLRLEGFDTVSPTDQTREFQTYRGVIGTMRAYEALRIGGDERVTRRVTLVRQQGDRLRDDVTREILLDTTLTLTRTESQPVERLAAQAWHDVHGDERRVARSWGDPGTPMLDPVWLYIETDDPREPLPRKDWADVEAIESGVDERSVIARFVLKQPRDRLGITRLPAVYYRFAAFYDRDGLARCPGCDTPKRQVLDESRTGDWCGCPCVRHRDRRRPSRPRAQRGRTPTIDPAPHTHAVTRLPAPTTSLHPPPHAPRRPQPNNPRENRRHAEKPVEGAGMRSRPPLAPIRPDRPAERLEPPRRAPENRAAHDVPDRQRRRDPAQDPETDEAMLLNRRTDRRHAGEIYIGRPSKWGNPFRMHFESDRMRTIALYRGDLVQRLRSGRLSRRELAEIHPRPKVCWCAPRACHGDVLEAAAAWAATEPDVALDDAAWTKEPITVLVARRRARRAA